MCKFFTKIGWGGCCGCCPCLYWEFTNPFSSLSLFKSTTKQGAELMKDTLKQTYGAVSDVKTKVVEASADVAKMGAEMGAASAAFAKDSIDAVKAKMADIPIPTSGEISADIAKVKEKLAAPCLETAHNVLHKMEGIGNTLEIHTQTSAKVLQSLQLPSAVTNLPAPIDLPTGIIKMQSEVPTQLAIPAPVEVLGNIVTSSKALIPATPENISQTLSGYIPPFGVLPSDSPAPMASSSGTKHPAPLSASRIAMMAEARLQPKEEAEMKTSPQIPQVSAVSETKPAETAESGSPAELLKLLPSVPIPKLPKPSFHF